VTDWGTGEHIFDQARLWQTRHDLTKPGGIMTMVFPHQGHVNHGFYSMHPQMIEAVSISNGYRVLHLKTFDSAMGERLIAALQRTTDRPWRTPIQGKYSSL
jgi:hypothetical protein